jgi:hypothetical protein
LFDLINAVRYKSDELGAYAYVEVIDHLKDVQRITERVPHAERFNDQIEGIVWMLNEYLSASKFTPRHRSILSDKLVDFNLLFDELRFLAQRSEPMRVDRFRSVHVHAQAA